MTTYIKLDDVQKILENNTDMWIDGDYAIECIEKELNSLPSINPTSMIDEMIEESIKGKYPNANDSLGYRSALRELLQKFKS